MSSANKPKDATRRKIPLMNFVTPADITAFQALPAHERRRVIVEVELLGRALAGSARPPDPSSVAPRVDLTER
jgi:hypothetical protein